MYDFLDKIGLKTALEQIKAKFPSSLPANGGNADYATNAGNADTVDNVHISCTNDAIPNSNWFAAFTDPNNLRAIDPERAYVGNAGNAITANTVKTMSVIGTASDVTHNSVLEWANSVNGFGTACLINAYGFPSDTPIQSEGFFTVETCYQNLRKYVTFKTFDGTKIYERAIWQGEWSTEWKEIYTSGNKPYVTGSVSISYSTESQNFEFLNFTPSAVICRYASRYENDGTIKWATPITNGFKVNVSSTEATSLDYIAFR